jgi:aryl-alcohol dehydrogenase-like predicted oxidoreductase
MHYRTLGRTGIKVSPYALGAMMFGAGGNPDHDDSVRIIHKALDAGINFVDTADRYSGGESEEIVGKALKGRRDDVVLATKVNGPMGADPNQRGNSRRWIMTEVESSLRRLQTDYIDLYQIHRPDPDTDIEETLSALSDLIHSGKVRAIGSSTMPASDMVEAQWVAERRGLERFRTEQPPYSILNRGIEAEVLPVAQRYGTSFSDGARLDAVEQIIPVAEWAGLPMTHLAMAFAIAHPGVTSAIIGPRTMEQLDDLLAGIDVTLSDDVLDRIDEIVPPGTDVGLPDQSAYLPPALLRPDLRRRPAAERAAA